MGKKLILIDGVVETEKDIDTWVDEFLEWLESRGEGFTGGLSEYKEESERDKELLEEAQNFDKLRQLKGQKLIHVRIGDDGMDLVFENGLCLEIYCLREGFGFCIREEEDCSKIASNHNLKNNSGEELR